MIFGKTVEEKAAFEQAEVKKKIFGVRKFAWQPIQLQDGRKVWLGFYYEYNDGVLKYNINYYLYHTSVRRYIDHSLERVELKGERYNAIKGEELQALFDKL